MHWRSLQNTVTVQRAVSWQKAGQRYLHIQLSTFCCCCCPPGGPGGRCCPAAGFAAAALPACACISLRAAMTLSTMASMGRKSAPGAHCTCKGQSKGQRHSIMRICCVEYPSSCRRAFLGGPTRHERRRLHVDWVHCCCMRTCFKCSCLWADSCHTMPDCSWSVTCGTNSTAPKQPGCCLPVVCSCPAAAFHGQTGAATHLSPQAQPLQQTDTEAPGTQQPQGTQSMTCMQGSS